MDEYDVNWVYKGPCVVSVIVNLCFLAKIVNVLVHKLHSDVSDRAAIVKTARAIGKKEYELGRIWQSWHLVQRK